MVGVKELIKLENFVKLEKNYSPHPDPLLKEREFSSISSSPSGEGAGG
jgi:hypothetical protein